MADQFQKFEKPKVRRKQTAYKTHWHDRVWGKTHLTPMGQIKSQAARRNNRPITLVKVNLPD